MVMYVLIELIDLYQYLYGIQNFLINHESLFSLSKVFIIFVVMGF